MGWTDRIKGAIYETDDKQREITTPASNPDCLPAGPPPPEYKLEFTGFREPGAVLDSDSNYKRLLDVTDPSTLPDLNKVYQLAKPLESIITDPALRLRAAFAQSGMTSALAVGAVGTLLDRLKRESEIFDQDRNQFAARIEASKADLKDLLDKTKALQVKIGKDQTALTEKTAGFTRALNRRRKELEDMKQQFAQI